MPTLEKGQRQGPGKTWPKAGKREAGTEAKGTQQVNQKHGDRKIKKLKKVGGPTEK